MFMCNNNFIRQLPSPQISSQLAKVTGFRRSNSADGKSESFFRYLRVLTHQKTDLGHNQLFCVNLRAFIAKIVNIKFTIERFLDLVI